MRSPLLISLRTLIMLMLALPTAARRVGDVPRLAAVEGGTIRGDSLADGGAVFKGIPFAAPPVGGLRWREPMPVRPWTGVRDATAFGPPCAQSAMLRGEPTAALSRDCLYLNVWAPEWPSVSRKPVMVWIPGGGNFGGRSNVPINDGNAWPDMVSSS
jgi:para-nitrobenzyl esterase